MLGKRGRDLHSAFDTCDRGETDRDRRHRTEIPVLPLAPDTDDGRRHDCQQRCGGGVMRREPQRHQRRHEENAAPDTEHSGEEASREAEHDGENDQTGTHQLIPRSTRCRSRPGERRRRA